MVGALDAFTFQVTRGGIADLRSEIGSVGATQGLGGNQLPMPILSGNGRDGALG